MIPPVGSIGAYQHQTTENPPKQHKPVELTRIKLGNDPELRTRINPDGTFTQAAPMIRIPIFPRAILGSVFVRGDIRATQQAYSAFMEKVEAAITGNTNNDPDN